MRSSSFFFFLTLTIHLFIIHASCEEFIHHNYHHCHRHRHMFFFSMLHVFIHSFIVRDHILFPFLLYPVCVFSCFVLCRWFFVLLYM